MILWHWLFERLDELVEVTVQGTLHYYIEVKQVLEETIQLYYMRMIGKQLNFQLTTQLFHHVSLLYLSL